MEILYLLKNSISASSFLTLVFVALFLVSLGMISHNAFAMGAQPGSCNNEYDGPFTNATIIVGNQTYYPMKNSVSFQLTNDKGYLLTYTIHTPSQNRQNDSLPGQVIVGTNVDGYFNGSCEGTAYADSNFTVSGNISHSNGVSPQTSQYVIWGASGNDFSYTVNWVFPGPQTLVAYSGNSQISLSWQNSSNNGYSPITNYKIYRSTSSGTETLLATLGNVNSYTDNSVINGQIYYYYITYVSNFGESATSNEVHAIPSTNGVSSSPQSLHVTADNSQATLSWTAPSSNGGSPITNYNVYRGTSSGSETLLTKIGNMTSYNDTTVTNSQTYYYKITSVNSIGESPQSNEASATPTAPTTAPDAPTGLAATVTSSSQINLSWTASANNGGSTITGYLIERSTDSGTTWSTVSSNTGSATTVYNDTGLAASTTYTYRVSATNSVGTGPPSNTASATTSATMTTGITLSNTQSTSGTVSSSNQITISSFNVGSDNNRLLVVGVSANNNDVASITFGGTSLTRTAYSFYNNDAEFWYLKNPSGTGDITVTMNGPTQAVIGVYAFSGVNQTLPISTHVVKHNTSANSPKISITTKYANDWVVDLPSIYGGSTLGSPTCTQQWNVNIQDAITGASSSVIVQTPGAVTCGWTANSGDLYDDAAVEINAAR